MSGRSFLERAQISQSKTTEAHSFVQRASEIQQQQKRKHREILSTDEDEEGGYGPNKKEQKVSSFAEQCAAFHKNSKVPPYFFAVETTDIST